MLAANNKSLGRKREWVQGKIFWNVVDVEEVDVVSLAEFLRPTLACLEQLLRRLLSGDYFLGFILQSLLCDPLALPRHQHIRYDLFFEFYVV